MAPYFISLAVVIGLSIICNGTGIYAIYKRQNRLQFVEVLLASLFVSHLLTSTCGYTHAFFSYAGLKFANDQRICEISSFVVMWLAVGTINHVVALSAHRYIQVMRPFFAREMNPRVGPAIYCALAAWISGIPICIPPLLGWGKFYRVENQPICGLDFRQHTLGNSAYLAYATAFSYILPVTFSCTALGIIWSKRERISNLQRRQYFFMELCMLLAFVVAWLPYALVCALNWLSYNAPLSVELICMMFAKFYTISNFLIYFVRHRLYRRLFSSSLRGSEFISSRQQSSGRGISYLRPSQRSANWAANGEQNNVPCSGDRCEETVSLSVLKSG